MKKFLLTILLLLNTTSVFAVDSVSLEEDVNPGNMTMEGLFLDGNILKISIQAKDMDTPVIGLAFHLIYEGDKLSFLRYDPGNFLEGGGDPFYLVENNSKNSKIIFGETLRREDNFPVGSEKVADFYFQILEGENFSFDFQNGVVSTLVEVRQDISGIIWNNLYLEKNEVIPEEKIPENSDTKSDMTSYFEKIIIVFLVITVVGLLFNLKKKKQISNAKKVPTEKEKTNTGDSINLSI